MPTGTRRGNRPRRRLPLRSTLSGELCSRCGTMWPRRFVTPSIPVPRFPSSSTPPSSAPVCHVFHDPGPAEDSAVARGRRRIPKSFDSMPCHIYFKVNFAPSRASRRCRGSLPPINKFLRYFSRWRGRRIDLGNTSE